MKIQNLRGWVPYGQKRRLAALTALLVAAGASAAIYLLSPGSVIAAMPLFAAAVFIECAIGLAPAIWTFALALGIGGMLVVPRSDASELFVTLRAGIVALALILMIEALQRARYGMRLVGSVARSRYEILLRHDNARSLADRAIGETPRPERDAALPDPEHAHSAQLSAGASSDDWRRCSIHLPGDEHAVLLFHGMSSSPLELRYLARFLNDKGFTVRIPMLNGYSVDSSEGNMEEWIEAALREFDLLAARYRHVSIGGLSMGATLALRIAQDRPRARSLALLSVSLAFDGWAIPWYLDLINLMYYTPLRRHYRYRESAPFGLRNEALRAKVARAVARDALSEIGPPSLSLTAIHEGGRLMSSAAAGIEAVSTATLVVQAIDDDTTSPHNALRVLDRISAPTTRAVWLDDSYHIVTSDNERELVALETAAFLREMEANAVASGVAYPIASKALARWNRRNVDARAGSRQAA
ncbi:alpha/beta hydrolase [Caballeronia sp. LZ035]|uniref:alpha/beta hydrolase n=1 Tax=Caballeronia sp. LZ035 TaxID=3038568 RepID=UPI0038D3A50A